MSKITLFKSLILAVLFTLTGLTSYSFAQDEVGFVFSFSDGATMGDALGSTQGIAIDGNTGDIYVADISNNRVQVFDSSGIWRITIPNIFGPRGVAIDETTDTVYIADSANHRIQVYDTTGAFQFMFGWGVLDGSPALQVCTLMALCRAGTPGGGAGQFNDPRGMDVDANGNIFVADVLNQRIQVFDATGAFILTFGWGVLDGTAEFQECTSGCQAGSLGAGVGQFGNPQDVALDASGNIYVSESHNNRVQIFDNMPAPLGSFDGSPANSFSVNLPISLDAAGNIYVGELSNDRIQVYNQNGVFQFMFGWGVLDGTPEFQICRDASLCQAGIRGTVGDGQFSGPQSIDVDQNGNIYVGDIHSGRVQVFSQTTLDITPTPSNGNVTSDQMGINCGSGGSDCSSFFQGGSDVMLTAAPDAGFVFNRWTGAACGDTSPDRDNPLTVPMDMNRSCMAEFTVVPTFDLNVAVPVNGTVTGTGINCPGDCAETYDDGTMVTLTAAPAAGYAFAGWTGASCGFTTATDNPITITMDQDRDCTATFVVQQFDLDVTVPVNGTVTGTGISCPGDCMETYDTGTMVTLTAAPAAGYAFTEWTGASCGFTTATDNPITITMDQDRTCTATFEVIPVTPQVAITVQLAGDGEGTVTSIPAGINCGTACTANFDVDTSVTLEAISAEGSVFVDFTGDPDCADGEVLADVAKTCIATFNLEEQAPELLLESEISGNLFSTDDEISFTVDITNPATTTNVFAESRQTATGVTFTLALPQGFTLVNLETSNNTECNLNLSLCAIGDILPGETVTVSVDVIASGEEGEFNINYTVTTLSGAMLSDTLMITVDNGLAGEGGDGEGDGNGSCAIAGPNTPSSSLLGLLLYAMIPAIMIARRRFRKQ